MASPPYNHSHGYNSAISPPYPANAQLPAPRRRHTDMPTSAPTIKRRKTSMLSTASASSTHPLRQTSFPPEIAPGYARSPSVDTMSMVSGSAANGPTKKKRAGGKKKNAQNDDASLVGGPAPSAVSGTSGRGGRKRRASEVSGDEEDDVNDEHAIDVSAKSQEEKQKEMENRSLLVKEFNPHQFARYEAWRAARLQDSSVRKLVNQTLSQSVPPSVILAIRSITKVFAGDLIEGARKVQTQWLDTAEEDQTGKLPTPPADDDTTKEKETRRGPLLPDHLRESLRRYRLSRDGGSVGHLDLFQHQHQSGVERFGVKVRGKRLMR
ncbi:histone-fold containing protein [Coleophoma crateriformis]|uniref:Histone-fold containing protein n=1 Tax=Coleophoma crateriformis TaxID=565419 RepID=A0A3D8T9F9_9HELO|nr:histone-fold containing protein [Coleophoma crateriformis]